MRWAGAPRALSPTRSLAAGVVGGTCPFSARSFCAGVKVCRALLLACRLAVRLALLGEARAALPALSAGAAPPPERLARLLTGAPHVTGAPWAQNTKNKTRAKASLHTFLRGEEGAEPPMSYAHSWIPGEGSVAAIGTPPAIEELSGDQGRAREVAKIGSQTSGYPFRDVHHELIEGGVVLSTPALTCGGCGGLCK